MADPRIESAETFEHHRLLGDDASRTFWSYMGKEYYTAEDIRFMQHTYCQDADAWKEVANWMARANGSDIGGNEDFIIILRDTIGGQWNKLLQTLDPVTKAAILATGPEKMFKPWPLFDERAWIGWIGAGRHGYVRGLQGTGKSDFLCRIGEIYLRHGGTILSTIPFKQGEERERYIYCGLGSTLVRSAASLKNQGIDVLCLRDEAFLHASGESPATPRTRWFRMMFRLFRKLGISDLTASQFGADILKDVRRESVFRVRKLSKIHKDRAHIEIDHVDIAGFTMEDPLNDYIRAVPATTLPFDTNAVATFQMDFNPDLLMEHLNRMPVGSNQYESVIAWLDNQGLVVTDDYKKWFARRSKGVISQAQCARILGVSQGTISNWTRDESAWDL